MICIWHNWEYFFRGKNTRVDPEGHIISTWYDHRCRQCRRCGKHQTVGYYDGWS